ncbi:UspA domain protein [Shewanella sediminis HAW-EB3]|uniref:UspA domain protein n=2 Tax=Shewanella sediminis TaxID=271097 RepID=A8FRX6_SHESH|nr:UspA domain protein [Shewanella sediminis HAW-EB3]
MSIVMIAYRHILAVVDTRSSTQDALHKALILVDKTHAKLTLLEVTPKNTLLSRLTHSSSSINPFVIHKKSIEQYRAQGIKIESKTRLNNSVSKAILEELEQEQYDLVILNYKHHHPLFHEFSFADEWRLLRQSDVAVMLVGANEWRENGHILTAIETDDASHQHLTFNQRLLDETEHIANLLSSDIHLVNCFLEQNISMAIKPPKVKHHRLNNQSSHWINLVDSAKSHQIESSHLHLEEGLPDHIIPNMAEKYGANIVILGAGEHHGLFSQFKGHTSEHIIDQLNCDIFAIKPASS